MRYHWSRSSDKKVVTGSQWRRRLTRSMIFDGGRRSEKVTTSS